MIYPPLTGEPPADHALRALLTELRDILVDQPGLRLLQSHCLLRALGGEAGEDRLDLVAVGHSGVTLIHVLFESGELVAGPDAWTFSTDGARPLVIAPPLGPLRQRAELLRARLRGLGADTPVHAVVLLARPLRVPPGARLPDGLTLLHAHPEFERIGARAIAAVLRGLGAPRIDAAALDALPALLDKAGLRPSPPLARVAGLRLGARLAETRHWVEHEGQDERGAPLRVRVWTTLDAGGDAALRRARAEAAAREAAVLHALGRHAGVLQLHRAVEHLGQPALVFEGFPGGGPLRQTLCGWAQSGASPTADERLRLIIELAGVVEHCHASGVVLGNLSPGALLLRWAPAGPRLLELRLHHVESALARLADRTVGTRHADRFWGDEDWVYAAPERRRGGAATVASDLFSLGAVAYTILTGSPPGAGFGAGRAAAQQAVDAGEGLHPQALVDTIEDELDALVAGLTHPDPDQRPPSARAWAAAAQALLPGRGPVAPALARGPAQADRGDLLVCDDDRRLRVGEVLGYGSTARVLEVREADGAGEPMALKVPRDLDRHAAVEDEAARFASVQAGEASPHIVASHGLVRIGGVPCLLMQHAGPTTLAGRVRRAGALPWAEVSALGAQLYAALDHVHERGWLHCDVKAENIGVDASGKTLRLFDLSLASRSRDDVRAGTEEWRDPGLAERGAWDAAADLYAAALCLHFALTGALPARDRAGFHVVHAEDYDVDGREALHLYFSRALSPRLDRRPPEAAAARREWRALLGGAASATTAAGGEAVSLSHLAVVLPGHPVSALGLSARALGALERLGVETAGELLPLLTSGRPPGVGPQTFAELSAVRAHLERRFAGRPDLPGPAPFFADHVDDVELGALEPALPAPLRAALEAAGLSTTGRLAAAQRGQVAQLVRRAARDDRKAWTLERLHEAVRDLAGDRDRTRVWVNALISRAPARSATQAQRVAEHLLGLLPLPGAEDPALAPPAGGVALRELCDPLKMDLNALRAALQKTRAHWERQAETVAEVLSAVRAALAACAGEGPLLAPVPEVARALLRGLGVAESPERDRRAVALVRLCAERGAAGPGLVLRRLGAVAFIAEDSELLDELAMLARRLYDRVFGLAGRGAPGGRAEAERPPLIDDGALLSKAEAEALLRPPAARLGALRTELLIGLAAAAAPTHDPRAAGAPAWPRLCLSPRGEPYAAGLPPARALDAVAGNLGGKVTLADLCSTVAQRLPEAAPLPDEPALGALLRPLGLIWASHEKAYVRLGFGSTTSTTRADLPPAERAVDQAQDDLRLRLRAAAEAGGFRALKVPARLAARAEAALRALHPELVVLSLDAALIDALDAEIAAAEADPEAVLAVEAQGAAGPHFGVLYDAFLERAWQAVVAGPLSTAAPVLLTQPGLLARWRLGAPLRALVREADEARTRRWLLCPVADEGAPAVIGHPVGDLPVPTFLSHQQIALSPLLRPPASAPL